MQLVPLQTSADSVWELAREGGLLRLYRSSMACSVVISCAKVGRESMSCARQEAVTAYAAPLTSAAAHRRQCMLPLALATNCAHICYTGASCPQPLAQAAALSARDPAGTSACTKQRLCRGGLLGPATCSAWGRGGAWRTLKSGGVPGGSCRDFFCTATSTAIWARVHLLHGTLAV